MRRRISRKRKSESGSALIAALCLIFIAGMLKLTEALLIATAIALGTGVSFWLLRAPV